MGINFEKYAKRGTDYSHRRLRLFDFVDDKSITETAAYLGQPGIIGYPFDLGVARNNGRVGAKDGPNEIRRAITNLAWHSTSGLADLGDIGDNATSLSKTPSYFDTSDPVGSSQCSLYLATHSAIEAGYFPIVLGGGHDLAAATTLAANLSCANTGKRCAIINFDAHFDLRRAPQPNSGTGFAQAAGNSKDLGVPYSYFALGISESSNSDLLFEVAAEIEAKYLLDFEVELQGDKFIQDIIDSYDHIYLSVDLDGIESSSMKAVSAPAPFGISVSTVERLLLKLVASKKVVGVDFAEFNPKFDSDTISSRVIARLFHSVANQQVRNCGASTGLFT